MESAPTPFFEQLSDGRIRELIESLHSLHEGELGVSMLVACGECAVPALRDFLLRGRPSSIFVPRQRAAQALAELGAKNVLLEYLESERPIADPVLAYTEDAVKNTVARALARWPTDDVFCALLNQLRNRPLPGVIETLGELGRNEAIPDLVIVLEDDFCRSFAEDALRRIGEPARPTLIEAARSPDPSGADETPRSRNRRRRALRLLEHLEFSSADWSRLAALLYERDAEIAARAAMIAMKAGGAEDKKRAIRWLMSALPVADWLLQGEIQECLDEHFDFAQPFISQEIGRRQTGLRGVKSADNVLRLLHGVVDRHARRGTA